MNLKHGDIVLVDLEPSKGSEQGKERPAVIIQNNLGNKHSPTTIVAPMTSSYDKVYPMNVEIESENSDIDRDSVILLNQIVTVDIETRIKSKFGELSREKMAEVERAIEISLGLKEV